MFIDTKAVKPKIDICKDDKNKILIQKPQILEQWKKHFIEHFNCNSDQEELEEAYVGNLNDFTKDVEEDKYGIPTLEEIELILKELKENKSPGIDNIPSELLKMVDKN